MLNKVICIVLYISSNRHLTKLYTKIITLKKFLLVSSPRKNKNNSSPTKSKELKTVLRTRFDNRSSHLH